MLDKINVFKKKEDGGIQKLFHVALTMNCGKKWIARNKEKFIGKTVDENHFKEKESLFFQEHYSKRLKILREVAQQQIELEIPIITFYVLPTDFEYDASMIDKLTEFFETYFKYFGNDRSALYKIRK